MKKIVIVGFYDLKEHMLKISELFTQYNYIVDSYPLFRYAYDINDKKENFIEHMVEELEKKQPDILIWWFFDIDPSVMKTIRLEFPNVLNIMYNTDDPMNYGPKLIEQAKTCDIVFSVCKENIENYLLYSGVTTVKWLPFGYDQTYFKPIDKDYTCDISIICQNLYDDPYFKFQHIKRKQLMDNISEYCKKNNKIFHIYGPMMIKEIYPENYIGEAYYLEQNKIFNGSKINLVTHPFCNVDNPNYDDEMKILGSGSLILVDKFKSDIYIDNFNCLVLQDDYITQINNILENYNYQEIKDNCLKTAQKYTLENWVKTFHIEITKKNFNESIYKELYDLEEIDLWSYWLDHIDENHITFDFVVPKKFNYEEYNEIKELGLTNPKKLYVHWYLNSKDRSFMKKKTGESGTFYLDNNIIQTTTPQVFEFFSVFNKISDYQKRDEGFDELEILYNNNPRVNINKIMEMYFDLL